MHHVTPTPAADLNLLQRFPPSLEYEDIQLSNDPGPSIHRRGSNDQGSKDHSVHSTRRRGSKDNGANDHSLRRGHTADDVRPPVQQRTPSGRVNSEEVSSNSTENHGDILSQSAHGRAKTGRRNLRKTSSLELPQSAPGKLDKKLSRQLSAGRKKSLHDSTQSGGSGSSGSSSGNSFGSCGSKGKKLERMLNKPNPRNRNSFHASFNSSRSAGSDGSGGSAISAPVGLNKTRSYEKKKKKSSDYDAVLNAYGRSPSRGDSDSSDSDTEESDVGENKRKMAGSMSNIQSCHSSLYRAHLRQELAAEARSTTSSSSRLVGGANDSMDAVSMLLSKSAPRNSVSKSRGGGDNVQRALSRRDMVRSFSLRALDEPGAEERLSSKSFSLLPPEKASHDDRNEIRALRPRDRPDAEYCLISRSFSVAPPAKKGTDENRVRSISVGPQRPGKGDNVVRSFSMKNRMGALLLSDHSSKRYHVGNNDDAQETAEQDEILSFGSDDSDEDCEDEQEGVSAELFSTRSWAPAERRGSASLLGGLNQRDDDHDLSGDKSVESILSEASSNASKTPSRKKMTKVPPVTRNEEDKFDWKGKAREDKLRRKLNKKKKKKSDAEDDSVLSSVCSLNTADSDRAEEKCIPPRMKSLKRSKSSDGGDSGKGDRRFRQEGKQAEKGCVKSKSFRRQKSSDMPSGDRGIKRSNSKKKSLPRSKSLGGPVVKNTFKPHSTSVKRTDSYDADHAPKGKIRSTSTRRRQSVKKLTSNELAAAGKSTSRKQKSFDNSDPKLLELLRILDKDPLYACVLLEQDPTLAVRKDEVTGMLPLHYATHLDAPLEVIEKLIEGYPNACDSRCEKHGFTPLHYAAEADIATHKIKALIKACPRALKTPDPKGQVPLHVAAARGASLSNIRLLVFIYPESIELETNKGETPRKIAKRKKASSDVLAALKSPKKN